MSETNPRLNQHTVVGETYRSKSKEKDFQSSSCGWGKADAHPQMLPDTLPLDKSQKLVVPLSLRNRLYIRRRLHEKMYYGQNHLVIIIMATSTWMEENSWRRGVRSRGPPLSALIRRLLRSFIRNDFSGAWASRVSALCPEMRTAASSSSSSSEIDFAHSTQTIRWRQRWWWGLVSLGVLYIYIRNMKSARLSSVVVGTFSISTGFVTLLSLRLFFFSFGFSRRHNTTRLLSALTELAKRSSRIEFLIFLGYIPVFRAYKAYIMTTTGSGRGMMLVCFVVMGIYKQRGKKKE